MRIYVGLDVHSKKTVFVAQNGKGKVIHQGDVPTTREGFREMKRRLKLCKGTMVALETGGQAIWVSRVLSELELNPVIIDAHEVRSKARRRNQKSDIRDAFEICDGLRRGIYDRIVYVPTPEVERMRRVLSRRRHFMKLRTMQTNAARYQLRGIGVTVEGINLRNWSGWEKLLSSPEARVVHKYLDMHAKTWKHLDTIIGQLEDELQEAGHVFEKELSRLMTMPGIGPLTAAAFVSAIGDPKRFEKSGQVASYLGMVPSTHDSGESERHGHITKSGPSLVRSMLCEAAHHASRPTHPLHPYFARLVVRGGYRKAVTAVAHRMARILFQMWRKGEEFDERKLNVVRDPEEIKKVVIYRIKCAA